MQVFKGSETEALEQISSQKELRSITLHITRLSSLRGGITALFVYTSPEINAEAGT